MALGIGDGRFIQADNGVDFAGESIPSYLERVGIPLTVENRGSSYADPNTVKLIRGFYPAIQAPENVLFLVTLGCQTYLSDDIEWEEPREFLTGDDYFVDALLSGRYLSFKIESEDFVDWRLLNYFVDFKVIGRF